MDKFEVLKRYFGYGSFREGQELLIDSILSGRDVLGIMPTGAGKSVCYQVPALMLPGITLVISPLISLMKDQVQTLNQAGVHAAYINSSLTENQVSKALQLAERGQYKIVYVAPERLETYGFQHFAHSVEISMVAVDEAHCISQWGQDFRPSYLKIVQFVKSFPHRPVVSAFTATATEAVRNDIVNTLELQRPQLLVTGYDRKNLYFGVEKVKDKDACLLRYVKAHSGESGIIYCATRKNVEKVYGLLWENDLPVTKYHAGLSPDERRRNQDDFIYDKKSIVVATNAFGMGIDKSNVRYVLHYNMPQSMENYYQEAGRAGRDGEEAECILLYSPQDVMINRFLIQNKEQNTEDFTEEELEEIRRRDEEKLKKMTFYSTTKKCLRSFILRYFGEWGTQDCGNCSCCLQKEEPERIPLEPAFVPGVQEDLVATYSHKKAGKNRLKDSLDEKQKECFEALRALRLEISREEGVPPYVVFSDKTLIDMCVKLPDTREKMLAVSGVGELKYERYGSRFLKALEEFRAGD